MKKNIWQRLTAVLMTAALVFSLLPMSAFAVTYESETLEYVDDQWMLGLELLAKNYKMEQGVETLVILYPQTYWSEEQPENLRGLALTKDEAAALNGKAFQDESVKSYQDAFPEAFYQGVDTTTETEWVYRDGLRMPKDTMFGLYRNKYSDDPIYWYGGEELKLNNTVRDFWPSNIQKVDWTTGELTCVDGYGSGKNTLKPLGSSADQKRPEDPPKPINTELLKAAAVGAGMVGVIGVTAIAADSYVVNPRKVTADAEGMTASTQLSSSTMKAMQEEMYRINTEYLKVSFERVTLNQVHEVVIPIKTLGRNNYKVLRSQGGQMVVLEKLAARPAAGERVDGTWFQEGKKLYVYLSGTAELGIGYDGLMAYIF